MPHEAKHASTSNVSSLASRVPKKPGNRQRDSHQVHETFTSQFLFPPRGEVGLRDPREHSHGVAHDMGTTISVKDSRGELPVGTLGSYICLKKPGGNLLPGTFGLTCHHVVFNFTGDASLPGESHLEITHSSQRDYENTIWTYEQRKGNLGLEIHEWTRTLNVSHHLQTYFLRFATGRQPNTGSNMEKLEIYRALLTRGPCSQKDRPHLCYQWASDNHFEAFVRKFPDG